VTAPAQPFGPLSIDTCSWHTLVAELGDPLEGRPVPRRLPPEPAPPTAPAPRVPGPGLRPTVRRHAAPDPTPGPVTRPAAETRPPAGSTVWTPRDAEGDTTAITLPGPPS